MTGETYLVTEDVVHCNRSYITVGCFSSVLRAKMSQTKKIGWMS